MIQRWFRYGPGSSDVQLFQQPIIADFGRWNWFLDQWMLYGGPYVSVDIVLVIITVWYRIHSHRTGLPTTASSCNRWTGCFACLGCSMLTAAAVWMFAYLLLMPTVIEFSERAYQIEMAYLRAPHSYIDAMNKAIVEVRAEESNSDKPKDGQDGFQR